MAPTTSYEVYLQKGRDWTIDSIFDDRRMALYEAQALLKRHPLPVVRVIEEKFDSETGKTSSTVIFRAQEKSETPPPPPLGKPAPSAAKPPTAPAKTSSGFVRRATALIVGFGATGLAALLGLAFLADHLR